MDNDLISRSGLLKDLEYDPAKRALVQPKSTFGIILSAPAVDAVEVVRCRDCKHYKTGEYFEDIKFCFRLKHPKENRQVGYIYPDDGFCSYGERRADET